MLSVTGGSQCFQPAGVPGDLVKEWIGHSSLRTTLRYTHFEDGFRKQTANETGLFSITVVLAEGKPSIATLNNLH
jgi:hypothetical protein